MNGLIFLIVIYFLKWIINDISKSEVSKVDQLINTITENKSIKYKSNDVELQNSDNSYNCDGNINNNKEHHLYWLRLWKCY